MNVMYFYCYNLQTNPKNTSVTQLFTLLRLGDLWVYWETTPVMIVIKSFTKIFCLHRLSTFWKIVLYKLLQNWSDFQMRELTGQTINTQTVDETTNFLITNHDLFRLIIERPNNDKTDVPGCYCRIENDCAHAWNSLGFLLWYNLVSRGRDPFGQRDWLWYYILPRLNVYLRSNACF